MDIFDSVRAPLRGRRLPTLALELHVFEAALKRKAQWFLNLFKADYEDMEPIHVAHRSLRDEYRLRRAEAVARGAEEGGLEGAKAEQERPLTVGGRAQTGEEYEDSWWTKVFLTLDSPDFSTHSTYMSIFMCAVVVLSCISYLLGTMKRFKYFPEHCPTPVCVPGPDAPCMRTVCLPEPRPAIYHIEAFTMIVFTVDYLTRVACVHAVPYRLIHPEGFVKGHQEGHPEPNGLTKTVSYMLSFLNLVDLAAVIPFYAHLIVDSQQQANLAFLRLLRLLKVMRVFKLGRYSEGHAILHETIVASVPALLIMGFFMLVVMVLFGAIIFYCEEGTFKVTEEYPEGAYFRPSLSGGEEVSPFKNIPAACYWVVMTATTVGYGDFYPSTPLGRFVAVIVAYSGIVSIALPVTIIGKEFNDVYFVRREKALQERALEKKQQAEAAAAAAGRGKDGAPVVVSEEVLAAAIQRQLSTLPAVVPSSTALASVPTDAAAGTSDPAATENGGAGAAAGAASKEATFSSEQPQSQAAGLRKRALTNMIREQLVQMDVTMQSLAARLDELEKLPQ